MNWIKSNFWEIERSSLLSYLGALLSFLHILTYFYWVGHEHLFRGSGALLCWSFLPGCQTAPLAPQAFATTLFTFFLFFGCVAFFLFLWKRFLGAAWFCLLFATIIKILFYLSDASLSLDAHALILFLSLCYLFVPNKGRVFRIVVISFYLITAFRLWNIDWLSGATLDQTWPLPAKGLEWVASLTLICFATMPFLLVTPFGQRLALAVSLLVATHGLYFYFQRDLGSISLIFISLFFIFDHLDARRLERESMYQSYEHPEPSHVWWIFAGLVFVFIQTHFAPQNTPLSVFYLQGPPKASHCSSFTFVHSNAKVSEIAELRPHSVRQGLECHPWLDFNMVKELCRQKKADPQFATISHYFFFRNLGDMNYKNIFSEKDFCSDQIVYSASKRAH